MTEERFWQLVRVTNPYGDRVYFASITSKGYDYYEEGFTAQEAKDKLFEYLKNNNHFTDEATEDGSI